MPTDPNHFLLIKNLFLGALAREPRERHAWLADQSDDPRLIADVERLLQDRSADTSELDRPAFELAGLTAEEDDRLVGRNIGPFRIEALIGRGGMGVVYRAVSEQPRRTVALKLIRGLLDHDRIRRLELEAQALALLHHPGIVLLYETGRSDDGTPWIAMEYVDGLPLDRFVREHALDRVARIQLFLDLLDAVAHAHARGVIHRDLKPANILVCTEPGRDASGAFGPRRSEGCSVRVLDFGLARLNAVDLTLASRLTEPGQVIGTLAYMSPEQARSDPVDQRSDVYSLGVLLYELLCDRKPIDLEGCWVVEAMERIANLDPMPPRHAGEPIDADLSAITMKAIARRPEERYQGVAGLMEDLERALAGMPILARSPSTVYQLRKLLGRHPTAVVTGLLAFLLLTSGGALFAWRQAGHVEKVRVERDAARAIVAFQDRLFAADDDRLDRDVRVTELLEAAAVAVRSAFRSQPGLEATVCDTLGATYDALGLYGEAGPLLSRALELRREHLGADHPDTMDTRENRAALLLHSSLPDQAEQELRALLVDRSRIHGPDHPRTLRVRTGLAAVLSFLDRWKEAEAIYRDVIARLERNSDTSRAQLLEVRADLAQTVRMRGDAAAAVESLNRILPELRHSFGEDSKQAIDAAAGLVAGLNELGRIKAAEAVQRELLATRTDQLGEDHPLVLRSRSALAHLLTDQNRLPEAERELRAVLEQQQRRLGRGHRNTRGTLESLAVLLARAGQDRQALERMRELVELHRTMEGSRGISTLVSQNNLAQMLVHSGEVDAGLELAEQTARAFDEVQGESHPDSIRAWRNLGAQLVGTGRLKQAERITRSALERSEQARGAEDQQSQWCRYNLAMILDKLDRPDEARILYEELFDLDPETLTESNGFPYLMRGSYGRNLFAQGLAEEAEEHLLFSYRGMRERYGDSHTFVTGLARNLSTLYQELGRTEEAKLFKQRLEAARGKEGP